MLLQREKAVTDPDFLRTVDQANARCDGVLQPHVDRMWEQAAKASGNDGDVLSEWLTRSLITENYRAAQKAAMIQMNRLKTHDAFIQAVWCNYLASLFLLDEAQVAERQLFASMAYRFLSKAAVETLEACKKLLVWGNYDALGAGKRENVDFTFALPASASLRTLQNLVDVELYMAVFKSQNRFQEALDFLFPENGSASLARGLRGTNILTTGVIELLTRSEQWLRLYSLTRDILMDSSIARGVVQNGKARWHCGTLGDDWIVWRAYVLAIHRIDTPKIREEYKADAAVFGRLNARHQLLAHLELLTFGPSSTYQDELILAIKSYLSRFEERSSTTRDLKRYIERLPYTARLKLVGGLSTSPYRDQLANGQADDHETSWDSSWIGKEMNSLKMEYMAVIASSKSSTNLDLLQSFVSNCLRLYRLSLSVPLPKGGFTERRCGDDAAILAALACTHLYTLKQSTPLLCAILILEELLSSSRHNYSAQVLLICLLMHYGSVTKAHEWYDKLEIKNIQQLTLSWMLSPRLGTIYPQKISKHTFDPSRVLLRPISWMLRFEDSAQEATLEYLKRQEYCQLLSHCRLRYKYANSTSRFVLHSQYLSVVSGTEAPVDESWRVLGRPHSNPCDEKLA